MDACSTSNCDKPIYARSLCRSHYRKDIGEGAKRWDKIKQNPASLARTRNSQKRHYLKVRDTPEYKELQRDKQKAYYHNNPQRKQQIIKWKSEQPIEKKRKWYKRDNYLRQFGGLREAVIERDGYKCSSCEMTRDEHRAKWKQDLNIHHLNGVGRSAERDLKDNRLENLVTLCKSCHMKADIKLGKMKK